MPSVVYFNKEDSFKLGYSAKNKQVQQFRNVLFDAKRMLGKKFSDPQIQEYMKYW